MSEHKEKKLSRRDFLQRAAIVGGALAITGSGYLGYLSNRSNTATDNVIARLNPAFRIKEISGQEIELFTHTTSGEVLKHKFEGLEADIFREINKEREINSIIVDLTKKHNRSKDYSKEIIQGYLTEFKKAKLIYYGEKKEVKLVEVING